MGSAAGTGGTLQRVELCVTLEVNRTPDVQLEVAVQLDTVVSSRQIEVHSVRSPVTFHGDVLVIATAVQIRDVDVQQIVAVVFDSTPIADLDASIFQVDRFGLRHHVEIGVIIGGHDVKVTCSCSGGIVFCPHIGYGSGDRSFSSLGIRGDAQHHHDGEKQSEHFLHNDFLRFRSSFHKL